MNIDTVLWRSTTRRMPGRRCRWRIESEIFKVFWRQENDAKAKAAEEKKKKRTKKEEEDEEEDEEEEEG